MSPASFDWLQHVLSMFARNDHDEDIADGDFDKSNGNGKGGGQSGGGGGKNGKPFKNTDPTAVDDTGFTVSSNASGFSQSVLENDTDADGDALTISGIDVTNTVGQVTMYEDGTFDYDPGTSFAGLVEGETAHDSFDYVISDGRGGTAKATVDITIVGTGTGGTDPGTDQGPDPSDPPPYYVEAMIRGEEWRLNPEDPMGTGTTVTFAFAESTPDYYDRTSFAYDNFSAFDEEARHITRDALQKFADVAGLTFVESSVEEADMVFGAADVGFAGVAYYPDANTIDDRAGDVWLDNVTLNSDLSEGSDAYRTLIHEIGHALGLVHPALPAEEESQQYSMMDPTAHPTFAGDPETPMLFDVAGLQWLYGANEEHAIDDTTYDYDALNDNQITIWDAGGEDTFEMSAAEQGVSIDLRQGEFSSVATAGSNNISIAFGAEIENAVGSAYDDLIVGNELDNEMTGGAGSDVFSATGISGNDLVLDFEDGVDRLEIADSGLVFEDLLISSIEVGTRIDFGTGTIILQGIDQELIDSEDFILF